MELYVATDPSAPIRTTVGDYVSGEWPRTMSVPTPLDPDWSDDGFILRVIYGGEYAIGELLHAVDALPGTSFETAIWYDTYTMEYLGLPIPYYGDDVGDGLIYINCTVWEISTTVIWLNSTIVGLDVQKYVFGSWSDFFPDGAGGYFTNINGGADILTIIIDPNWHTGEILFLWSYIV